MTLSLNRYWVSIPVTAVFVSPCTLRSTQCAALIALAAAAGIARVASPVSSASDGPVSPNQHAPGPARTVRPTFFEIVHTAAAPWVRNLAVVAGWFLHGPRGEASSTGAGQANAFHQGGCVKAELTVRVAPSAATNIVRLEFFAPAFCARRFVLPFAVGPPADECIPNPNASGTNVPGDPIAAGLSGSRIACLWERTCEARLARLSSRSFEVTEQFSLPGSALRREPLSHLWPASRRRGVRVARSSACTALDHVATADRSPRFFRSHFLS